MIPATIFLRFCRPYSDASAFLAGVGPRPALAYLRIAERGANGAGYDALFSVFMADLVHLARLPAEKLGSSTAGQAAGSAALLMDTAADAGKSTGVPSFCKCHPSETHRPDAAWRMSVCSSCLRMRGWSAYIRT